MITKRILFRYLVFLSILVLTGCHSPYVYKSEVSKFQNGVEQAAKMVASQEEILLEQDVAENRKDLIEGGYPRLYMSDIDKCNKATTCLYKLSNDHSDKSVQECSKLLPKDRNSSLKTKMENYRAISKIAIDECKLTFGKEEHKVEIVPHEQLKLLIGTLNSYAKALAGIVDAKDSETLSKSSSKACGSATNLYSATSDVISAVEGISEEEKKKSKTKLEKEKKAATEVCGFITESGSAILEQKKLATLTKVVNGNDKNVGVLATYLSNRIKGRHAKLLLGALVDFQKKIGATKHHKGKDKEYLASIDAAIVEKNKFVNVLKNDQGKVFLNMKSAHGQLKKSLNEREGQLDKTIEGLDQFYQSANGAYEAVKALSKDDGQK